MKIKPLKNRIGIIIYDDGTLGKLLGIQNLIRLRDDDPTTNIHDARAGKHPGIRPRWAFVISTSPEAEEAGIHVGDKVLIDHGRWSRGITVKTEKNERFKYWTTDIQWVLGKSNDKLTNEEKEQIKKLYPEAAEWILSHSK